MPFNRDLQATPPPWYTSPTPEPTKPSATPKKTFTKAEAAAYSASLVYTPGPKKRKPQKAAGGLPSAENVAGLYDDPFENLVPVDDGQQRQYAVVGFYGGMTAPASSPPPAERPASPASSSSVYPEGPLNVAPPQHFALLDPNMESGKRDKKKRTKKPVDPSAPKRPRGRPRKDTSAAAAAAATPAK
jgi:hypothetical protein